jgi:hypothetical protein
MNVEETNSEPLPASVCSGFVACADCDDEMCAAARECFGALLAEAAAEEDAYITRGVCSDCGACSLKDASGRCRPRPLGDTGDVTCAGEKLWQDEDDSESCPNR